MCVNKISVCVCLYLRAYMCVYAPTLSDVRKHVNNCLQNCLQQDLPPDPNDMYSSDSV